MKCCIPARFAAFAAVVVLAFSLLPGFAQNDASTRGRKYKAPPPAARIQVTVLRDTDGKPLENISVIFHPIEGDRDKGGMEIKTDEDGKALIDVIPIGDTVRMQVLAKGYQTYGEDYKVEQLNISKEVRLKRPSAQYTLYKNNTSTGAGNNASGSSRNTAQQPNSAPAASGSNSFGGGQSTSPAGDANHPPSK